MRSLASTYLALITFLSVALAAPHCGLTAPDNKLASASDGPGSGDSGSEDVIATAWYPGWLGAQYTPDQIPWDNYNSMTFAFAVTTPDPSVISMDDISKQTLPVFVSAAKAKGVSPRLSIGGWTGSQYFSSAVSNPANQAIFAKAVMGLVNQYQLDGIDFDWEYPNRQGVGCNEISPSDSANFLAMLQMIRQDPVGAKMAITVAVGLAPFMGPDGTPMTDVSAYAKVIDHIAIMDYDVWGAWSPSVGPNAPIDDSCAPVQAGSARSAIKAWTSAGFPAQKIALGVAAYGHSFHVANSDAVDGQGNVASYPPFDKAQQPHGDKQDGNAGVDQCGNPVPIGGIFNFWGLIEGGFLKNDGTPASGINYRFDNCSQSSYVYNPTSQVMVSFDDAKSFAAKGQFINDNDLGGFAVWHVGGDSDQVLLKSISQAMGIQSEC